MHHARSTASGFVIGALMALTGVTASAGIAVSPLKQEVTVKPGGTETFYITVGNHIRHGKGRSRAVRLEVMDFSACRKGGLSFDKPGTGKHAAGRWIKLSQSRFVVAPGKGKKIACEISVPWTARGEYYSAIMVTPDASERVSKGVKIQHRIASGVFVTVPGRTYPKKARVIECSVAAPSAVAEKPALTVTATIANEGRVLFVAKGEVRIRDKAKRRLWAKFPLKTRRERVLPGDLRDFWGSPSQPLPAGEYVAEVVFDYGSKWKKARAKAPFSVSPAQAKAWQEKAKPDEGTAIVVKPARIEQALAAGGFRRFTLRASNTKPFPVDITVQVVNPEEPGGGLGKWIVVNPVSFGLTGNGNRTIVFNLLVPKHAKGKHKGTLQLTAKDANGRNLGGGPTKVPLTVDVR